MRQEGRGVTPDPQQARICFTRASHAGALDAKVALAEMWLNGRGGVHAPTAAVELFHQAAGAGHAGAMFALVVSSTVQAKACHLTRLPRKNGSAPRLNAGTVRLN
jgi:hypothetical protein